MDPYNIRELFQAMEYDLIKSLKRSFEKHALEEIDEGFKWEMWQLTKLREMEKYRQRNREIIGQYSPEVERIIQETLSEYYVKGEKKVVSAVKKMDEITLAMLFPKGINVVDSFSPENIFFGMNDKKLEALIKTVRNDLKNPEHAVLRKMDDVYRQTIYRAEMSMTTGTKTLGQAIDMATIDFRESGLNVVQYSNGSMHNLATYAEMALRTASQRATFMGEGKKRDQFGIHLVVVSAHASTCDDCLPWQAKVLIDDVYSSGTRDDGDFPFLSTAFDDGLGHPSCRHGITTFYPGVSRIPEVPPDDVVRANYKAEQRQRAIERNIRKYKLLEVGSVDPANQEKYAKKVREWQGKMREHLNENSQLRRDYRREKNY